MNNSRDKALNTFIGSYGFALNDQEYSFVIESWQAATEQSQKEIEALQAREKVLVELLGECVDTIRNEYNEMLELYSSYPHKEYDIQCQKELLNGIEQALANVRGEVK